MPVAVSSTSGKGLERDTIAAAYLFDAVADVATVHYHSAGQQPLHEMPL